MHNIIANKTIEILLFFNFLIGFYALKYVIIVNMVDRPIMKYILPSKDLLRG